MLEIVVVAFNHSLTGSVKQSRFIITFHYYISYLHYHFVTQPDYDISYIQCTKKWKLTVANQEYFMNIS